MHGHVILEYVVALNVNNKRFDGRSRLNFLKDCTSFFFWEATMSFIGLLDLQKLVLNVAT
jgi:hypothetical protein